VHFEGRHPAGQRHYWGRRINFAIPGTGVKTIVVGATGFGALPAITDPVTIDGYTQPGSSPNTKAVGKDAVLKIELNGTNVNGGDGLLITHVSGSSVIRGLAINRFPEGIEIQGDTVGNRIEGNFIGTDPSGTIDRGNSDDGVNIFGGASENVVGGSTPAARNVISGNEAEGVLVRGTANEVLGNRVGTTANGTGALANALDGVSIQGSNNFVGDGTAAGSNTIAFNGDDGVSVTSDSGNEISRNSVFSNAGIGIDLEGGFEDAAGYTANDPGDIDTGSNGLQNKPVISSAKTSSTKTTITGKLATVPNTLYRVEFFSNPSGNEGKKFVGLKLVSTDASGNATFTFSPASKVAAGQTVTATARGEFLEATAVGTSEFCAPKKVASS
jgi:hypothetical protein